MQRDNKGSQMGEHNGKKNRDRAKYTIKLNKIKGKRKNDAKKRVEEMGIRQHHHQCIANGKKKTKMWTRARSHITELVHFNQFPIKCCTFLPQPNEKFL